MIPPAREWIDCLGQIIIRLYEDTKHSREEVADWLCAEGGCKHPLERAVAIKLRRRAFPALCVCAGCSRALADLAALSWNETKVRRTGRPNRVGEIRRAVCALRRKRRAWHSALRRSRVGFGRTQSRASDARPKHRPELRSEGRRAEVHLGMQLGLRPPGER
jgi:hypothetical protein